MARVDAISWMWPEACAMIARAERLNCQFFHIASAQAGVPAWEPPVDILEAHRHLVVIVALPGVGPEAVSVTAENGTLVVAGERSLPAELSDFWIHRLELPQGRFERRVPLPRGSYHDIRCTFANGCLFVTLSKLL